MKVDLWTAKSEKYRKPGYLVGRSGMGVEKKMHKMFASMVTNMFPWQPKNRFSRTKNVLTAQIFPTDIVRGVSGVLPWKPLCCHDNKKTAIH